MKNYWLNEVDAQTWRIPGDSEVISDINEKLFMFMNVTPTLENWLDVSDLINDWLRELGRVDLYYKLDLCHKHCKSTKFPNKWFVDMGEED